MNDLTKTGFDMLLTLLDADREQAGASYERLRTRLARFFEWRDCEHPEELADIVFDRIIKKLALGEQVLNVEAYAITVAQFVLKEDYRERTRQDRSIDEEPLLGGFAVPEIDPEPDTRMDCLEKCLKEFSDDNRGVIVAYYDTDERTMIAARKRLAESLGVSLNTLRIRVCRLKTKLEECARDCCRRAGA